MGGCLGLNRVFCTGNNRDGGAEALESKGRGETNDSSCGLNGNATTANCTN